MDMDVALSTARFCRAGQLAIADTCYHWTVLAWSTTVLHCNCNDNEHDNNVAANSMYAEE